MENNNENYIYTADINSPTSQGTKIHQALDFDWPEKLNQADAEQSVKRWMLENGYEGWILRFVTRRIKLA